MLTNDKLIRTVSLPFFRIGISSDLRTIFTQAQLYFRQSQKKK